MAFSGEYKGEDGQVKIAKIYDVKLRFVPRKNVDPPCNVHDMAAYHDYLKKIARTIKDYADGKLKLPPIKTAQQ